MKRLVSKHTEEAAAGRDEKLETCLVMFGYPTISFIAASQYAKGKHQKVDGKRETENRKINLDAGGRERKTFDVLRIALYRSYYALSIIP